MSKQSRKEIRIRRLGPADAASYQQLRLEGLREHPAAFGSAYEEEVARTIEDVAKRLDDGPDALVSVFGAFDGKKLGGVAALKRTLERKLKHNAMVVGVYVSAALRRQGAGRALLEAIIDHARTFDHVRNLKLGAGAYNLPAIRLYQSVGFQCSGVEIECLCVDGVYYDEELYHLALRRD